MGWKTNTLLAGIATLALSGCPGDPDARERWIRGNMESPREYLQNTSASSIGEALYGAERIDVMELDIDGDGSGELYRIFANEIGTVAYRIGPSQHEHITPGSCEGEALGRELGGSLLF